MQSMKECLLIEDDLDDQEIFKMCIKKISNDINCTVMNDGVEALAMLSSNKEYIPQYIFIDMNMPKMNGMECLTILKQIKRLNYTRFFMYSTTSEKSTLLESKRLGAEDFIIKPSKTNELKEKLSIIFNIVSGINN